MIEKKIEIEVVSANLKMNLTPDKSEALSEFKEPANKKSSPKMKKSET